jgi:hypothetical protein
MRVIEEVKSLRLQFISIFFVFVSTVMIQYADFCIGEYQNSVSQEILEASNLLQIHTSEKLDQFTMSYNQFLPLEQFSQENLEIHKNRIILYSESQLIKDPNLADLITKLMNDSISLKRYFGESGKIHQEKARDCLNKYNAKVMQINIMLRDGSVWKSIKTYILFPIQVAFMCMLAIGYYRLMTTVSMRITVK